MMRHRRYGTWRGIHSLRILCAGLCGSIVCVALSQAATLTVDRNSEADLDHYNVYLCASPGCTVLQNSAMKQSVSMPQSVAGVKPSVTLDLAGKEGAVAVSASDLSGNESGLSVPVPFDRRAPAVPLNPVLQ